MVTRACVTHRVALISPRHGTSNQQQRGSPFQRTMRRSVELKRLVYQQQGYYRKGGRRRQREMSGRWTTVPWASNTNKLQMGEKMVTFRG
eukprot:scaffold3126_cov201-Alexandrium_tamarense.AAC.5